MIITTGRKPSQKTRRFCKHLSVFMGCEYVTRGKKSFSTFANKPLLLRIGESKGNPARFDFFLRGKCILSIKVSVSLDKEAKHGKKPVIEGNTKLAFTLSKATGLEIGKTSERLIKVSEERIVFMDKDIPYIILKLKGVWGEDFAFQKKGNQFSQYKNS